MAEAYHASNCQAALGFAQAVQEFQSALHRQAANPNTAPAVLPSVVGIADEDPASRLPPLSKVFGAYELVLAPLAIGGLAFVVPMVPARSTAPVQVAEAAQPRVPELPAPASSPGITTAREAGPAVATLPAPAAALSAPPAVSFVQPAPKPAAEPAAEVTLERMVTRQPANVRANPDRNSASVRTIQGGTALIVFKRQGSWVEVGDAQAWGWVHASLLRRCLRTDGYIILQEAGMKPRPVRLASR